MPQPAGAHYRAPARRAWYTTTAATQNKRLGAVPAARGVTSPQPRCDPHDEPTPPPVVQQSPPRTTPSATLARARVVVYCQVSSDEQAQADTIQNQIAFARRYCDLHGLPIADIYADEGVSGTVPLADRPAGVRLLADAQAGRFGTVLVYRIDRLARSTRILLDAHDALHAAGVALRSMIEPFDTTTPLGEFILTLLGSLAALERATIVGWWRRPRLSGDDRDGFFARQKSRTAPAPTTPTPRTATAVARSPDHSAPRFQALV